ncbi:MAG: glycosyltransferase family 2 protein [Desulfomonilaceae bacterium]
MSSSDAALPTLSVAVIAKNEADRIGRLLDSVAIADEVVVVDSGSTDGTIELCEERGARVVFVEWQGYARQKQVAMELARGEWVLNLDADEALSPDLAQEILKALERPDPAVKGFSMPRLSRYLGRWIWRGGWYPDRKVRLVRKGCGRWTGDGLHERLEVDGIVRELRHPLFHFVYRDISDQVRTINNFSSVFVQCLRRPASSLSVWFGLLHAFGKFFECAFWKLGLLDGMPGLIIAVNSAFYVFLKHAKAWERTHSHSRE